MLLLVVAPGIIAVLAEIYKCCLYEGVCGRLVKKKTKLFIPSLKRLSSVFHAVNRELYV